MGTAALVDVVLRCWRLPAGTGRLGRLEWGMVAVYVVLIWIVLRRHIATLSQLDGQIEKKTFVRLSSSADTLAFSGYLMILFMLVFSH
jgi:hypothetical protein